MQKMSRRSSSAHTDSSAEQEVTPLRARIRQVTAEAIATAAEAVFAEQGLHDAHVGDIAKRAGVAVGTLYNHFKDREAILAGLLEVRRAELVRHLDTRVAEARGAPYREQVRAFVAAYFDFFEEHRRFFNILIQGETARLQETYPVACQVPSQCMREIYARAEALVRRGCDDGTLEPSSAEMYPAILLGMMRGMKLHSFFVSHLGGKDDYVVDVDRLVDIFLDGARAKS